MSAGIIGLPGQARAMTSQWGESERNRWILGSFSGENKIYLVDYDEESSEISIMTFAHSEKVSCISASTRKKELIATVGNAASIWSLSDASEEDFKSEAVHNLNLISSFPTDLGIKGVLWEPKGNRVASFSQNQAHLYDLNASTGLSKPTLLAGLQLENNDIYCGVWNPHSDRIMAFGAGKSIIEYDFRANQKPMEIPQAHDINVRCLDYNHNRPNYLVSGGDDCMVRIWDSRNSKTSVKEISDHTHWVWGVQFNRFHDQLLLTCSSDAQVNLQSVISISSATMRLFSPTILDEDTETVEPPVDGLVTAFEQHEESVYCASWSPSDPWIFASISFDGRFVINQVPQDHKYKILSV